jgi:hypothetical protein
MIAAAQISRNISLMCRILSDPVPMICVFQWSNCPFSWSRGLRTFPYDLRIDASLGNAQQELQHGQAHDAIWKVLSSLRRIPRRNFYRDEVRRVQWSRAREFYPSDPSWSQARTREGSIELLSILQARSQTSMSLTWRSTLWVGWRRMVAWSILEIYSGVVWRDDGGARSRGGKTGVKNWILRLMFLRLKV